MTWNTQTNRSRRVLFVQVTGLPSGSPMSGLMIAEAFKRRGWDVDVVFAHQGDCVRLFKAAGCRIDEIRHGKWLYPKHWWQQARRWGEELWASHRFFRLIQSRRHDLVYINTLTGVAAALAARRAGVPCVWHVRELFDDVGGEMRTPPVGGLALARRILNQFPDEVVTISEVVQRNMASVVPGCPVTVVPNAVFDSYFSENRSPQDCRRQLGVPADGLIMGMPGVLRPVKGHDVFLQAARLVAAQVPEARFLISGDGPAGYRAHLHASIQGTDLSERVQFLGTVDDMPAFYRACDISCIPSYAEPAGRVVIESMAIGTPIVATNVGGIPEFITHEVTGLLSPAGNSQAMAENLLRLVASPELRRNLVTTARERATAMYRQETYGARIMEIVERALEPGKKPGFEAVSRAEV